MFAKNKLPNLMKLEIVPFAARKDRPVKIDVHSGERRLQFNFKTSARETIEVPIACTPNQIQCKIDFLVQNPTSPKKIGQSSDARILGFALYSFSFE
jgi:hypothetical protein